MRVVQFYRGEIPNNEGLFFDDFMLYGYEQLEADHAYIQWVLPNREPSMFNEDAPLITEEEMILFREDPELKEKAIAVAMKMLDFYGMSLQGEGVGWQTPDEIGHHDPKWWLRHFNHNFLRVTRMLTSLRYLGLENWSLAMFDNLLESRDMYGETSYNYWSEAATGPLP